MTLRLLALLMPLLLLTPQLQPPDAPGPIVVGKKGVVVAGDTLAYTISWGPGARATSYNTSITVAGSNGAWSVVADSNSSGRWTSGNGVGALPSAGSVTFTTLKTWVAASPWDSATFTVSVTSKNAIGTSTPVTAAWSVKRKPGPPGPITVDSSLIIIGLRLLPDSVRLAPLASVQFCALIRFANGAYALRTVDKGVDSPECPALYQQLPATQRLVSIGQQAKADSVCILWSATGGTIEPEVCGNPAMLKQRGLLWTVAIE